jgi:CDP-diacylglycerol--glycerol-3-phosphate 3-phosphatidyltransferase
MTEKSKSNTGAVLADWRLKTRRRMKPVSDLIRIIPGWVPANLITLLRALLLIPIFLAYRSEVWGWMIGLYLLAWFTDVLDGLHARYRGQISPFGNLLDPAVDKVFVVALLLMAAPERLSYYVIWTVVGLEIAVILMAIVLVPLAGYFKIRFKTGANLWGKLKMLLQGLALSFLLIGLSIRWLQTVAEIMFWSASALAIMSIIFYIRSAQKLTH